MNGFVVSTLIKTVLIASAIVTTAVTTAAPSWAQRSNDYNPSQFVGVLNGLGYPVQLTDGLDNPNVQQAIRDFQMEYGLPITGSMTPGTQDFAANLVGNLQRALNRAVSNGDQLPGSQFFSTRTDAMVRRFQDQNRLPITGIATLETRRRLDAILQGNPIVEAFPNTAPSPPDRPIAVGSIGRIYIESELQQILSGLGYDIDPQKFTNSPSATIAIQDFQQRYNLPITGVADQRTQETIQTILRVLQANLRIVIDRNLTVTEFYDRQTREAVVRFQRQYDLRPDGIATVPVRRRIDDAAKLAIGTRR
jgi:peptidoglycan hydrolase-like protein with peptidoglycan-binding domain